MTHDEMITTLHKTQFRYVDPPSKWEDIGFTERPIWVNSDGYGYVMCDEHIECGECDAVSEEKWFSIIEKIKECTLTIADIENTSLFDIINEGVYEELLEVRDTEDETEEISSFFSGLIDLSSKAPEHIWWLEDSEGSYQPMFFGTEESFNKAYERDWCDYSWDDLDDEMLAEWIRRLSE